MSLKDTLLEQNRLYDLNMAESDLLARIESNISKTYAWMGGVLLITFLVAYYVYNLYLTQVINPSQYFIGSIVAAIGGFGLIIWMSFGWSKMSYSTLAILFIIFGVLEGFGLSSIFLHYQMASIINVFLTTSVMFLLLAIAGNYLKIDVTKLGSVLFFGLIALLVGMLINMFWHNTEFNIWLNVIGIVIFSGFVVYDTAVLKQNAATPDSRIQIILAVSLFLDFINLFLMLLDLIGNNKD